MQQSSNQILSARARTDNESIYNHNMGLTVSHFQLLEKSNCRDFSIFKFSQAVGRDHALVVFGTHLINSNNLGSYINQTKYAKFLTQVSRFY